MTDAAETFLKYVKHSDIVAHEARGWIVVSNFADFHHGRHAVLMEWRG